MKSYRWLLLGYLEMITIVIKKIKSPADTIALVANLNNVKYLFLHNDSS